VLVTCARDVLKAMAEVHLYTQRMLAGEPRSEEGAADPKFKLERCKRADAPAVPKEETPREELTTKVRVATAAAAACTRTTATRARSCSVRGQRARSHRRPSR